MGFLNESAVPLKQIEPLRISFFHPEKGKIRNDT